ncbi:hypothetical protein JXA48_01675 [Candidatus Woesearchaeota archaeon]|nr:hypothetical protein [Candidatus Woesearchaeota archaeon]
MKFNFKKIKEIAKKSIQRKRTTIKDQSEQFVYDMFLIMAFTIPAFIAIAIEEGTYLSIIPIFIIASFNWYLIFAIQHIEKIVKNVLEYKYISN